MFSVETKTYFTCFPPHLSVNLQKTIKDMRKLSITLLLISISFMTMKAYNLSEYRSKGSITFTSIFVKVDNIASRLNANFK